MKKQTTLDVITSAKQKYVANYVKQATVDELATYQDLTDLIKYSEKTNNYQQLAHFLTQFVNRVDHTNNVPDKTLYHSMNEYTTIYSNLLTVFCCLASDEERENLFLALEAVYNENDYMNKFTIVHESLRLTDVLYDSDSNHITIDDALEFAKELNHQ